jgi:hypothetical protein
MDTHIPSSWFPTTGGDPCGIEQAHVKVRTDIASASWDAAQRDYLALHEVVHGVVEGVKERLLMTPLAWSDAEVAASGWIQEQHERLAQEGFQIAEALARDRGFGDARTLALVALAFHYYGESMKCQIALGVKAPRNHARLHVLMQHVMDSGRRAQKLRLAVDGRMAAATLESLYFRALLLARFAGGSLNCRQIEILDAWMWVWMPVLAGVSQAPPGSALRADLDSADGLRRGPREDPGPSLYLPQDPIEGAYRSVVRQFHKGRIIPEGTLSARFRMEEHVAVLDAIHRGLEESRHVPTPRAERVPSGARVEIFIGLPEILAKGWTPMPSGRIGLDPLRSGNTLLATWREERDAAIEEIYDVPRRIATIVDTSETGIGIEVSETDGTELVPGALIALRFSPQEIVLGKVARNVHASAPGMVTIGIRRISAASRPVRVAPADASMPLDLLWVPGDDASGRRDAFIMADRRLDEYGAIRIGIGADVFTLKFNRMRDQGRGWALAGFAIARAEREAA